ncbi:hypothetical protein BV22DRAFT_1024128, partial [Leucogyrophana mollusca]
MVQSFITHVLGVSPAKGLGSGQCGTRQRPRYSRGFYGSTNAYYGTVEQQGRLTLHLHMLVWIKSALTPQEIRDRIMDPSSDFQKEMVHYLEAVHSGEFVRGTEADVRQRLNDSAVDDARPAAINTLPVAPPCECDTNTCKDGALCESCCYWNDQYIECVDEILLKCNTHRCRANKRGKCKARFPRQTFPRTCVDPATGALNMKKGEPLLNSFTYLVTYLFRCNTDVTSLLSGTAIKAVVAYISDYISKPSLKTYVVFDTIKSVFDK